MHKLIAMVFCVLCVVMPVSAQAPTYVKPIPTDVKGMIVYYADKYKVDSVQIEKTLFCESGLNPLAKNITSRERSYGISQINLMAHTTITIEQATDPKFAIEWTAKQFAANKQGMWTCYKKLFGTK